MKSRFCLVLLFVSLILSAHCQDDDYDTEPDDAVNDYSASEQPEFFKNAFVDGQGSRQAYPPTDNAWGNNQFMGVFPFVNIGDTVRSSALYPPFYSPYPMAAHSLQSTAPEHQKPRNKPMKDDFFTDDKSKDNYESNSFRSVNSKPQKFGNNNPYHGYSRRPMIYGLPGPYMGGMNGGRFNPYQNLYQSPLQSTMHGATMHYRQPIGPPPPHHHHQHEKNDNFDEELKKLGIDLGEFGLGGGKGDEEKKEKKQDKKKKKDKKTRPLFPSLFRTTTAEPPTKEEPTYLKSNVENDISNLGFNMDNYGIKEHKLEKQVYGNQAYQYPMQAVPSNGYREQDMMKGQNENLNYKNLNSQLEQYSDNQLNSLIKSSLMTPVANDATGMLPIHNADIHNAMNPVFTPNAADHTANLNDIAAINLLENGINDLNGFTGKAHEYHHSPQDPIKETGIKASFTPIKPNSKSPPKFLQDSFFKDEKPKQNDEDKQENDEETDYEPVNRKKNKKAIYQLNSEVRSNKYFESVTSKPKTITSYSSTNSEHSSSDGEDEDRYSKSPKYNDEEKQDKSEKPVSYSKEYTPSKYKFGYRYYGRNSQHDDYGNKKGDTMKLVKQNNESNDKSTNESLDDQSSGGRSNEDHHSNNQPEEESHSIDKGGDTDDSNNEANTESPRDNSNNRSNQNQSAEDTNYSTNDDEKVNDKVDEEFSGSRKRRSISNNDYFRSVDRKLMNDHRVMMPLRSDRHFEDRDDLMENQYRLRPFRRHIYSPDVTRRRSTHIMPRFLSDDRILSQPTNDRIQRRKHRIVSFDSPLDSHESKQNYDNYSDDFEQDHQSIYRRPYIRKSLKDEYEETFNLKAMRAPQLERRRCSSGASKFKRLQRVYSRDDTDFYSNLSKNPMYKSYQYL